MLRLEWASEKRWLRTGMFNLQKITQISDGPKRREKGGGTGNADPIVPEDSGTTALSMLKLILDVSNLVSQ